MSLANAVSVAVTYGSAYASALTGVSFFKNGFIKPLQLLPDWATSLGVKLPDFFIRIKPDLGRAKTLISAADVFPKFVGLLPEKNTRNYFDVTDANSTTRITLSETEAWANFLTKISSLVHSITETLRYLSDKSVLSLKDNRNLSWVSTVAGAGISVFSTYGEVQFLLKQGSAPAFPEATRDEKISSMLKLTYNASGFALSVLSAPYWTRNLNGWTYLANTVFTISLMTSILWDKVHRINP